MKKTPRDVIILSLCTTSHDHMINDSWDMEHKWHNFLSFLPFDPTNNPKNQKFGKIKEKPGNIIILHLSITTDNHMNYGSWDMECDRRNFYHLTISTINKNHMIYVSWDMEHYKHNFLSFWAICALFYPNNKLKNQNFEKKNKKTPGDIIILHLCTKNDHHMYGY